MHRVVAWKTSYKIKSGVLKYSGKLLNKKRKKIAEKDITKLTQVKYYANLTGTENIPITRVKCMLGVWNNFFLPGKIRTFLFKFYNNSLGLNSRVTKFINTVDQGCTFCILTNTRLVCKESFLHLFYYCDTTNKIIAIVFSAIFYNRTTRQQRVFFGKY